jgi:hypothetical protein
VHGAAIIPQQEAAGAPDIFVDSSPFDHSAAATFSYLEFLQIHRALAMQNRKTVMAITSAV